MEISEESQPKDVGVPADVFDGMDDAEDAATKPARTPPPLIRYMPPLFSELWDRGVSFSIDGTTGDVVLDGFYGRPSKVRISIRDNGLFTKGKGNKEVSVESFDDLATLNFAFWLQANSKKGVYVHPEKPWLDTFVANGWVRRQAIFVPVEDAQPDLS